MRPAVFSLILDLKSSISMLPCSLDLTTTTLKPAIAALAGIIFPPFIAIILLANILKDAVNYPIVKEAFWGIRISVIILIIVTIKDLWKKSVNSPFSYTLFFAVTLILLLLPISPAIIIILSALSALAIDYIKRRKNA